MSKIIICGLNGSGKTTLGRELAKKINYLYKDIENYYFDNELKYKYEKAYSRKKVIRKLEEDFRKYDNIIFSSCKGDYGDLSALYDLAVFIRLDKKTRLNRVIERSYNKFGSELFQNRDLYEKEMRFWNMVYNKNESVIKEWFDRLKCAKFEIDGNKMIKENVMIIFNQYKNIL